MMVGVDAAPAELHVVEPVAAALELAVDVNMTVEEPAALVELDAASIERTSSDLLAADEYAEIEQHAAEQFDYNSDSIAVLRNYIVDSVHCIEGNSGLKFDTVHFAGNCFDSSVHLTAVDSADNSWAVGNSALETWRFSAAAVLDENAFVEIASVAIAFAVDEKGWLEQPAADVTDTYSSAEPSGQLYAWKGQGCPCPEDWGRSDFASWGVGPGCCCSTCCSRAPWFAADNSSLWDRKTLPDESVETHDSAADAVVDRNCHNSHH